MAIAHQALRSTKIEAAQVIRRRGPKPKPRSPAPPTTFQVTGHRSANMCAETLQPAELQSFFAALAEEPNDAVRDFIILAVLTGACRSNVVAMTWAAVNLNQAVWRVRGELMKNGQPQAITLTPEAVAVLEQRHERRSGP